MGFIFIVLASAVFVYLYYKFFPSQILDIAGLGKWALVTGSTDGIGKAFAHELGAKGYNIVLVSRNSDKLNSCAKEIEEKFHVSTKVVQADFSSLDDEMYSRIKQEVKHMDVGILVNNVGIAAPHPEYFLPMEEHHADLFQGLLNTNISSTVNMTRFVLPGMVERGKGLIINVSSGLGQMPSPMHTLYGASKSFITKFSQDLDTEYASKGVHVHVLNTGLVATKLSGLKTPMFFGPSPDVYVKSALEEVTKRRSCDGYIGHSILSSILGGIHLLFPALVGKLLLMYMSYSRKIQIKRCRDCSPRAPSD